MEVVKRNIEIVVDESNRDNCMDGKIQWNCGKYRISRKSKIDGFFCLRNRMTISLSRNQYSSSSQLLKWWAVKYSKLANFDTSKVFFFFFHMIMMFSNFLIFLRWNCFLVSWFFCMYKQTRNILFFWIFIYIIVKMVQK